MKREAQHATSQPVPDDSPVLVNMHRRVQLCSFDLDSRLLQLPTRTVDTERNGTTLPRSADLVGPLTLTLGRGYTSVVC